MTTIIPPICLACKHYDHEQAGAKCVAFPVGIPRDIYFGDFIHVMPYAGETPLFEADRALDEYERERVENAADINHAWQVAKARGETDPQGAVPFADNSLL